MMNRERIGTEVSLMASRLKRSLRNGKDSLGTVKSAVSDRTRNAARKTDYYVHDNAWKLLGVVAGIAFAAGFLLSRRNEQAILAEVDATGPEAADPRVQEKVKKLNSWEFLHSALPMGLFLWKALQASRCTRVGQGR